MKRGKPGGPYQTLVQLPRILVMSQTPTNYWPDTLSVATNGYLYVTANELHRQPSYHFGKDWRIKPYRLYRVKVNATPVLLK